MQQNDKKVVLRLRDIHRVYKVGIEKIHALKGVELEIGANEYVAVMGKSGSGKSTLLNILGCLDRPTRGSYELDGKDTQKLSDGQLARIRNEQIGFIFQSFELLGKLNAIKNVELSLIYSRSNWMGRKKKAISVLQRVGLGDRVKHKPNQLSGGEKQRVAIARALICGPSILLADEPTGNLDTKTSEDILELFDKLHNEGQTIIMVTHEESVAKHAHRVIIMKDGMIISDSDGNKFKESLSIDGAVPNA